MSANPIAQLEKLKEWQEHAEKCSPEELAFHEAEDLTCREFMERAHNLVACERGIRQAEGASEDELLFLRDAIFSDMLEIVDQQREINGFLSQATSDRAKSIKSERLELLLQQQAVARQEKLDKSPRKLAKAIRLARKDLIEAAITRSQCQTVLADADMERLGEKVAELFPTFRTHDGVRSNWGLRIKAGKASGS